MTEERHTQQRRLYEKPTVEQIKLVAEEQVLGLCKTASAGGGIGVAGTDSCFLDGNCKEDGT